MQLDALAQLDLICADQAEHDGYADNVRASVGRVLMIESETASADRLRSAERLTTACLGDDPFCDDLEALTAEITDWKAACRTNKAGA
jgi:hypothetical protein